MAEIYKNDEKKHKLKSFNPESSGYDKKAAQDCGLGPDDEGHWPSRCPDTGQLLKGRNHETWDKLVEGEKLAGYTIYKGDDGKYYSKKIEYKEGK